MVQRVDRDEKGLARGGTSAGVCRTVLNEVCACRSCQACADRERARQSGVGAVERKRLAGGRGGLPSAFLNEQNAGGNIPFVTAVEGHGRISLSGSDQRKRIGDGSDRAAPNMRLKRLKPADSQFPRIDECEWPLG